ncbi:hypothetical protein RGU12_20505 [Fredinandcohnia sp. QZ13]|uniref:hypothetical protein n=1 Tax=Fredinandcohnia sp. QZ13 TaxID=3073144 RepID=UPI0028535822|nr:hypothetical protein [Fredinandcohnia sp. QZ13]MDR4889880.1 hypothetical protein [Fredinandcohnia sp. QZ13]
MRNQNQKKFTAYHQKYFRPSCLEALNVRFNDWKFYDPYYEKTYVQIQLPRELTKTPEDTLINYFSILREAATLGIRSCGSIGNGDLPFPIAYNFLSKQYQEKLSYEKYVESFAGIGHTSLLKLCRVPAGEREIKFFYEIETIELREDLMVEYFGYSYGFIQLEHEKDGFRISEVSKVREDFLCAPYHGWSHDGESVVDIKFGEWCKMIQHKYPIMKNGYTKNICFHGRDGADYCIVFFTLTNGTDVEIAQFRKVENGLWEQVHIKPEEECIPKKENDHK